MGGIKLGKAMVIVSFFIFHFWTAVGPGGGPATTRVYIVHCVM